jgi:hypothetical protein
MRSAAQANLNGGSLQKGSEGGASSFKVKFGVKLMLFTFSVVALSWFFEGSRQIQQTVNFSSVGYLVAGVVLTLALVLVQAFLIYAEERAKGTRTRNIPFFDKLYVQYVAGRAGAKQTEPGPDIHSIEVEEKKRG